MSEAIEITLLTQSECRLCERAKQILARLAVDYPLRTVEVDLFTDRGRDLGTHAGVAFAPGVLVNGEPFSYGRLSERKLRRHLDTLLAAR